MERIRNVLEQVISNGPFESERIKPEGANQTSKVQTSQASASEGKAETETTQTKTLSIHALDTVTGKPASGLPVTLEKRQEDMSWKTLAKAETNQDGRVPPAILPRLAPGVYACHFDTAHYFSSIHLSPSQYFYPYARIVFFIHPETSQPHYHIPLLLSPFSYTTYRGS